MCTNFCKVWTLCLPEIGQLVIMGNTNNDDTDDILSGVSVDTAYQILCKLDKQPRINSKKQDFQKISRWQKIFHVELNKHMFHVGITNDLRGDSILGQKKHNWKNSTNTTG